MAAQPVAGFSSTYIGTVGTILVTDRPTTLYNIMTWGTFVGTVVFYDASSTTGTSATNMIGTLGLPNTAIPGEITLNFRTKAGLVYASTGTPNISIGWD